MKNEGDQNISASDGNAVGRKISLQKIWHYIAPGKHMQRAVERDAVHVTGQARVALGCWRADHNDWQHSQLGWKTPSEFAMTCHPRRDLALRYAEASAPAPVASTAQPGKSIGKGELRTG